MSLSPISNQMQYIQSQASNAVDREFASGLSQKLSFFCSASLTYRFYRKFVPSPMSLDKVLETANDNPAVFTKNLVEHMKRDLAKQSFFRSFPKKIVIWCRVFDLMMKITEKITRPIIEYLAMKIKNTIEKFIKSEVVLDILEKSVADLQKLFNQNDPCNDQPFLKLLKDPSNSFLPSYSIDYSSIFNEIFKEIIHSNPTPPWLMRKCMEMSRPFLIPQIVKICQQKEASLRNHPEEWMSEILHQINALIESSSQPNKSLQSTDYSPWQIVRYKEPLTKTTSKEKSWIWIDNENGGWEMLSYVKEALDAPFTIINLSKEQNIGIQVKKLCENHLPLPFGKNISQKIGQVATSCLEKQRPNDVHKTSREITNTVLTQCAKTFFCPNKKNTPSTQRNIDEEKKLFAKNLFRKMCPSSFQHPITQNISQKVANYAVNQTQNVLFDPQHIRFASSLLLILAKNISLECKHFFQGNIPRESLSTI